MTERIAPLLRWAEGYYPSRAIEPPDIAGMNLTEAELLFALMPTRLAHLALVDPPAIRDRLADPVLADAAREAWERHELPLTEPGANLVLIRSPDRSRDAVGREAKPLPHRATR